MATWPGACQSQLQTAGMWTIAFNGFLGSRCAMSLSFSVWSHRRFISVIPAMHTVRPSVSRCCCCFPPSSWRLLFVGFRRTVLQTCSYSCSLGVRHGAISWMVAMCLGWPCLQRGTAALQFQQSVIAFFMAVGMEAVCGGRYSSLVQFFWRRYHRLRTASLVQLAGDVVLFLVFYPIRFFASAARGFAVSLDWSLKLHVDKDLDSTFLRRYLALCGCEPLVCLRSPGK